MTREPIFVALADMLASLPGVVTVSRRLKHWNDTPPVDQPAVYITQRGETADVVTRQPTRWKIEISLYVYARTTDKTIAPSTVLNPLLDAISDAFLDPRMVQTLGGLVHYARISGRIETDEGSLGDQAVAIVPIEILTV